MIFRCGRCGRDREILVDGSRCQVCGFTQFLALDEGAAAHLDAVAVAQMEGVRVPFEIMRGMNAVSRQVAKMRAQLNGFEARVRAASWPDFALDAIELSIANYGKEGEELDAMRTALADRAWKTIQAAETRVTQFGTQSTTPVSGSSPAGRH